MIYPRFVNVWLTLFVPLLMVVCLVASCATTQQLVIKSDMAFAQAVYAVDDAEYAACQTQVLDPVQCAAINPSIIQALLDVKAVTLAIKAAPTTVPTSLPALLLDLNKIQQALAAVHPIAFLQTLSTKVSTANAAAIALLSSITGGS